MRWNSKRSISTKRANRLSRRSGAAIIEFAVILPVYVLVLFGTIEACKMIFLQQSLEIAAYEATRIAIVPGTSTTDIQAAVEELLGARRVKDFRVAVSPTDFQHAPYGSFIRIDVAASCSSNSSFPLRFYSGKTLTGTVEMMKEFD